MLLGLKFISDIFHAFWYKALTYINTIFYAINNNDYDNDNRKNLNIWHENFILKML